jgi:predicted enzyme related to lactoylglutathione lyase
MAAKGTFVWYELMTSDLDAAGKFYAEVAGWSVRDSGMPGTKYMILNVGETGVGGMMPMPPGAHPGWIGYILVDDADKAAARLSAAGGAIHRPPSDIPGVGRFAVAADPQGAVFTLFQPSGDMASPPPAPEGTPGHFGWHELHAAEWEAAFAFYAGQFGWTKATAVDTGPMGTYQLFSADDRVIGGMMTKTQQMPVPAWLFYVNVAKIDAATERVRTAGGTVLNGPHEVPGGSWVVQCLDPQGAMFALVQPPA